MTTDNCGEQVPLPECEKGRRAIRHACVYRFHDFVGRPCYCRSRCLQTESDSGKCSSGGGSNTGSTARLSASKWDRSTEVHFFFLSRAHRNRKWDFFFLLSFFKGLHGTSQSGHKPPDASGLAQTADMQSDAVNTLDVRRSRKGMR